MLYNLPLELQVEIYNYLSIDELFNVYKSGINKKALTFFRIPSSVLTSRFLKSVYNNKKLDIDEFKFLRLLRLKYSEIKSHTYRIVIWAVKHGYLDIVKWLMAHGLTVEEIYAYADVAIVKAISKGKLNIIKYLRNKGLNHKHITCKRNNGLHFAARKGHLVMIKYLVEHMGLTLDDIRSNSNYALRLAALHGHLDVIKYLVSQGLTIEDFRCIVKFTVFFSGNALHYAVRGNQIEVIKYFIQVVGLTLEDIRSKNNYALHYACEFGKLEMVKYLISLGLTLEDIRSKNNYALRKACEYEYFITSSNDSLYYRITEDIYLEIIRYLVSQGLTLNDMWIIPQWKIFFKVLLKL